MTRPVRTCRTRQKPSAAGPDQSESDQDVAEEPQEEGYKPGKKRARRASEDKEDDGAEERPAATVRKKLKRVGKLSRLQEMPLDVLFEVRAPALLRASIIAHKPAQIFSFLHPYDLLRISRTTKTLRNLLMARSARTTWIQALATIPDLPPCPDDLTEPAWTRLVFDPTCHVR
jgi:hypothetical protein